MSDPQQAPDARRATNLRILQVFGAVAAVIVVVVVAASAFGGDAPAAAPAAVASTTTTSSSSTEATEDDPETETTLDPALTIPSSFDRVTARQWKRIARDPDGHVGEGIVVYGRVTQADASTGTTAIRADVDGVRHRGEYGYLDYDTNTILSDDTGELDDVVEDDIFRAKVVVAGSFEYETAIGGETSVPLLLIQDLRVIGSAD